MARTKLGTLVDMLVIFAEIVLLLAVVFGIYCFFRPGTWSGIIDKVASVWNSTKDKGDRVVNDGWGKVKNNGDHLIESVPREKIKRDADAPKGN